MPEKISFSVGDLVRRKNDIYDDGIVLLLSSPNIFVVFCKGSEFNCQPYAEEISPDEISLVQKEIHKSKPKERFSK